jgi:hypothetical protein
MRKQSVKQENENNGMENALEALGKSIARWTDKSDRTPIYSRYATADGSKYSGQRTYWQER